MGQEGSNTFNQGGSPSSISCPCNVQLFDGAVLGGELFDPANSLGVRSHTLQGQNFATIKVNERLNPQGAPKKTLCPADPTPAMEVL